MHQKRLIRGILTTGFFAFLTFAFSFAFEGTAFALESTQKEVTMQKQGNEWVSPIISHSQKFYAIGITLSHESENWMVNWNPEKDNWESAEVEIEQEGAVPGGLMVGEPSYEIQLKYRGELPEKDRKFMVDLMFYDQHEFDQVTPDKPLLAGPMVASTTLRINKRSEWGADEGLRYWTPDADPFNNSKDDQLQPADDTQSSSCSAYGNYESDVRMMNQKTGDSRGNYIWPLQYVQKIKKIVIHHTGSEIKDINGDSRMDRRDYAAVVRAIYHYHASTLGWGDIGYHYIIDPLGNIYEGRYGGDKVIGGHVYCHNQGALGIAVIGNYEHDRITTPALNSLTSLIALKSKQYNIDPQGNDDFRGRPVPNIIGHRDLRPTACPGKNLYAQLSRIREKIGLFSGNLSEDNVAPLAMDYNASFVGEELPYFTLNPNERKTITLQFKNTGKKKWDSNTWIHVALNNNPNARIIPLLPDKEFVATDMKETAVSSGGIATFEVELEAGYKAGTYSFELSPVANGRYKISRSSVFVTFRVEEPTFDYQLVKQSLPNGRVFEGQTIDAWVDLKNTGNVTWKNYGDQQITLGTVAPNDRNSIFIAGKNPSRIGYLVDSEVPPGETGRFVLNLEVPTGYAYKRIEERFAPVVENVGWLKDKALGFAVTPKTPVHAMQVVAKSKMTKLNPGEMKKVVMKLKNSGDLAWTPDNMRMQIFTQNLTVFKRDLRPEGTVEPGEIGEFTLWVQAPYEEGTSVLSLYSRFNDLPIRGGNIRYVVNTPKPIIYARLEEQSPNRSPEVRMDRETDITVKFKNTGNTVWRRDGANAIHLGTSKPHDRESRLYYEKGWFSKYRPAQMEEEEVAPGEIGTFTFTVRPESRGFYREYFQLVAENKEWIEGSQIMYLFKVTSIKPTTTTTPKATSTSTTNKTTTPTTTPKTTTTKTTSPTVTSRTYANNNEDNFRVLLSHDSTTATFEANVNYKVYDGNENQLFSLSPGTEVEVKKMGGTFYIKVGNIVKREEVVRIESGEEGIVTIKDMERRPSWNTDLNDNQFRETIEMRIEDSNVVYINELDLEHYLQGIAEVSNSAPNEKRKVLAILARTYARFYMSDDNRKFPGEPYDGSDDPNVFQRYLGYGYEKRSPDFVKAVKETEGLVVTYDGKLVKTPYFSQSDGKTLSAEEVWGWDYTPYLVSVPDPWCEGLKRSGHGVGLSGYGAEAQANEGKNYEEIIKYYYEGVEIEKVE